MDILNKKSLSISFEVFPPKKEEENLNILYETLNKLKTLNPNFISVTYGANGTNVGKVKEIAHYIQNNLKVRTLAHLTCVASSREYVDELCTFFKNNNISNILALRGDIPLNPEMKKTDFTYASDLVKYIKSKNYFTVGGACYPEKHFEASTLDEDIKNLKIKVDKGLSFLITQLFFVNNFFYEFKEKIRKQNINIPLIAGIMPITSYKSIERIASMSNTYIPKQLSNFLYKNQDNQNLSKEVGINYCVDQIIDLINNNVEGIHLYIMNNYENAKIILDKINERLK